MVKIKQDTFSKVKELLLNEVDSIQKLATKHHKVFLGGENYRTEHLEKYQQTHMQVVSEIANNLEMDDLKKGTAIFKKLGTALAKESVKDELTIEEAVNGIIFLKQAVWQKICDRGLLNDFDVT